MNLELNVSKKNLYVYNLQGVLKFKKKIKKNEGFLLRQDFSNLFFTFRQGSLNPPNYELAPQLP